MKITYKRSVKINTGNYENTDVVVGLEADLDPNEFESQIEIQAAADELYGSMKAWVDTKLKHEIQRIEARDTTRFGMEP